MNTASRQLIVATALVLVAGCSGLKEDLGIGVKRPPDEFTTYSRAPLSLPPDYGLRPPAGSTGASQAAAPREMARQAMMGSPQAGAGTTTGATTSSLAGISPGQQVLLERTGGAKASPEIRSQVNRETTVLAEADQSFVERLMFWSDTPDPATVVNAGQEARRIQENQALNKPLSEGETPTIRRKPKALLEGIF